MNYCFKCEERHELCHMECPKYDKFLKKNEEIKAERKKDHIQYDTGWGYIPRRSKTIKR